jgi:hypothetical protein
MEIFLFGDSFSANVKGWPSMLGQTIINSSQNGIGEYKIYKMVMQKKALNKIICHTSPWRIHTPVHPIHNKNSERPNNDFLLSDINYHSRHNDEMKIVKQYWKRYYDQQFQIDIYNLILDKLLSLKNTIHITFHDPDDTERIQNNFNHIWKNYPGNLNHLSIEGNQIVAEQIKRLIKNERI